MATPVAFKIIIVKVFYLIFPIGVLHVPEGEREALQDGHQHPQRQSLPHQAEGLLHRVQ